MKLKRDTMHLSAMKNAISCDLEFSLRELPETRVRKMDKRDTGIKNKGDEKGRGAAHKSE